MQALPDCADGFCAHLVCLFTATRPSGAFGTIRKAVDELVAQNMLVRQQGRGTFVATHDRARSNCRLASRCW